jgi:hypothetical protein
LINRQPDGVCDRDNSGFELKRLEEMKLGH